MDGTTRVVVVGLGYIGLPAAVSFATGGLQVTGVDLDEHIVKSVNHGEAPFAEPDLSVAVSGAVAMGRLTATTEVPEADAYVIAVPTPVTDGHQADLSHVLAAVEAIAPRLSGGEIIVLESTVPPGTTRRISELLARWRPDLHFPHVTDVTADVRLAHCPERVLPGRVMIEITANDRVIGGMTPACGARAADLYRTFCRGELLVTDAESAEMAKLAENAYRDVNIAFANELSVICDRLGLDVWEIRRMANRHPRVDILRPGPGVGGHCIAIDPWFLIESAPDLAPLMRAARHVNEQRPAQLAEQIIATCRRFRHPRVTCLGLAFKADVGDLRESPAVEVVSRLARELPGAHIDVVEPHITQLPAALHGIGTVRLAALEDAVAGADVIVLLVDHALFRGVKKSQLAGKAIYDTRGMLR
ncbi:MAG: UDP-N-acetyl-D-mannosamine dehydrogenase [Streptosporangiaceae bacterium]